MSEQPEALRLADELLASWPVVPPLRNSAAELRRLHALCEEMGEALETSDRWLEGDGYSALGPTRRYIRAAIAKWKESK